MMSLDDFLPLPPDVEVYQHQIGGHGLVYEKTGKVLCGPDKTVFKAVQLPPKGVRELEFYRKVFCPNCSDPVLLSLRSFIPTFKGLFYEAETQTYYLCMEDILGGMKNPSVIDIKVGAITFAPDATPAKIAVERAKYLYREDVGFLLTGIKVFDPETFQTKFFDRFHGRSLDSEQVYTQGMRPFLGRDPIRAKKLAFIFLSKITPLQSWFLNQSQLSFYASSILLAYDSDSPRHPCPTIPPQLTPGNHHPIDDLPALLTSAGSYQGDDVQVKWVDFTHTAEVKELDNNFIFGLNHLIDYLIQVLTSTETQEDANLLKEMLLSDSDINGQVDSAPTELPVNQTPVLTSNNNCNNKRGCE